MNPSLTQLTGIEPMNFKTAAGTRSVPATISLLLCAESAQEIVDASNFRINRWCIGVRRAHARVLWIYLTIGQRVRPGRSARLIRILEMNFNAT